MPTLKQKTAFRKVLENVGSGNPKTGGQILAESGYRKIRQDPKRIFDSKGFQELLAQVNDEEIVNRISDIMRDKDKRTSLAAADMLLKLKDRYPAQKSKIMGLFENLTNLEE